MNLRQLAVCIAIPLFLSCRQNPPSQNSDNHPASFDMTLSDSLATPLARTLYANLHRLSGSHTLVGHQDALAYGMGWEGDSFRTDIHGVCGDHPAVFGWDLGHLGDAGNIDGVPFGRMREWAVGAFEKGGINTYSWHMRNYATGGTSWDTDPCVAACLPGGEKHRLYLEKLDLAADFFGSLRSADGEMIPVIFRPFHEMNGGWFWWGSASCSPGEYKEIFRFTVDYLRKEKGMHQLLIAYSPDNFKSAEEYLERYPGDGYVDVMGFDDYHGLKETEQSHRTLSMLAVIDSLSSARGKLMAITETGVETIPDPEWFTGVVLPTLEATASSRRTSWILFWRNGRPDHFYGPYPGHPSAPDFRQFVESERIMTLSSLPPLYQPSQ